MVIEVYKDKLDRLLTEIFKSEGGGHDIYHLDRVFNLALHLQQKEGGDRLIIGASAFLHDVHRLMQNETGEYVEPKDSLDNVRELLKQVDFPEDKIGQVLHCV